MTDQQIKQLISQINSIADRFDEPGPSEPATYRSGVEPPIPWDKWEIEESLGVVLPTELAQLWNHASRISLYVDITYNQWGTVLWSPDEIIDKQKWKSTRFFNAEDFHNGDLIIGEFLGNDDLALLIRCDQNESDFGEVIVAASLDSRKEWYTVAPTINIFLEKMNASTGIMYWEYGFTFDKKQIEKWWAGEITKGWVDVE